MDFKPTKNKLVISIVIPTLLWIINFSSSIFGGIYCKDCTPEFAHQAWINWNITNLFYAIGLAIVIYIIYSLIQKK